jgi:hypothetical protein
MKQVKGIVIAILLLMFSFSVFAKNTQITPSSFEWMAKTSINIMETYKFYSDLIEREKPKLLIDARTIQTANREFFIPTTLGDITVNPFMVEVAVYWKWQPKDSLSFSFLAFHNGIDLIIDDDAHPELIAQDSLYNHLDWPNGKSIIAVRPDFNKNIDITAGVLLSFTPYITTDSLNNQLFDLFYDDDKEDWETRIRREELFLDCVLYGYKVRTFYEFKESSINLFQLNKELNNKRYGEFELGFNYYKHSKTVQTGFQYKNSNLIKSVPIKFDFFWDIHKKNQWNELSYTQLDMTLNFFEWTYDVAFKDLCMSLNWGISYSKCIFDEALLGYSWKISFENMWKFSMSFGGSYNDYKYLSRVPIKDETLITLDLQFIL